MVRPLTRVCPLMSAELTRLSEAHAALVTHEGPFTRMSALVRSKVALLKKSFGTYFTVIWPFCSVGAHVPLEAALVRILPTTLRARLLHDLDLQGNSTTIRRGSK